MAGTQVAAVVSSLRRCLLYVILFSVTLNGWTTRAAAALQLSFPPRRSHVILDGVSQAYPVTLLARLFSSVPKREFALKDVSLEFGSADPTPLYEGRMISPSRDSEGFSDTNNEGVCLLVGRSSSGKSTVLRLICGVEEPAAGRIIQNGEVIFPKETYGKSKEERLHAKPIILDRKPDCSGSRSVWDLIVSSAESSGAPISVVNAMAKDFTGILGLNDRMLASRSSELSPSGQYKLGIATACMQSVATALPPTVAKAKEDGVYYPIILFDELFDFEHPGTVARLSGGILKLVELGAVVVSATHKPAHFDSVASRVITMSGGQVLSDVLRQRQPFSDAT